MLSGRAAPGLERPGWKDEAVYFLLFNATNVLNYGYLLLMGFLLTTEAYGLFGALFGLVYQTSALGNSVKIATARQIARLRAAGGSTRSPTGAALLWPGLLALATGLLLLGGSGLLARAFDSPREPVLWMGAAIALSVWVPGGYGLLQGYERFAWLGAALMAAALVRIAAGAALVGMGAGVDGALAGVVAGYAASAGVTLLLVSRLSPVPARHPEVHLPAGGPLLVVLLASLIVAAPTSLDVVLVRHLLTPEQAGTFTGIAVLGRTVIFASVAIPFITLPKIARRAAVGEETLPLLRAGLIQTAVVAGGAALAIGVATSGLGWDLTGVDVSRAGSAVTWYLPAMVAFSLVVVLVYYHVATGRSAYIVAVAAPGIALQAALVFTFHGSLEAVARAVFAANLVLLAVSLLLPLAGRWMRRPDGMAKVHAIERVDWDEAKA